MKCFFILNAFLVLFIPSKVISQTDSAEKWNITFHFTDTICNDTVYIPRFTFTETGIASFYGTGFHGKRTSSGEIFDKNKMTAAHKNLPLGTYVKVTNLSNNQWVIVKINDRMPQSNKRAIDLSEAAAKKIGYYLAGLTKVRIEVLNKYE